MKRKGTIKKGIAWLMTAVMMFSITPVMAEQVQAQAEETPSTTKTIAGLGTSVIANPTVPASASDAWKGSYVYYGNYDADGDGTAEPVKYRVLDASTTDFSADGTTQTMFLDCDSILYDQKFDNDGTANEAGKKVNDWSISDVKSSLNGDGFLNKEGVFTTAEKNAIAASTVASHELTTDSESGVGVASGTQNNFVYYVALTGEQIFLLDAEDVSNGAYGYSMTNIGCENRKKTGNSGAFWWLRSALNGNAHYAGYVRVDGYIHFFSVDSSDVGNDDPGVSPAFNVNLSSVLFSSVISGTAGETGAEYKLTLLDGDMTIAPGSGVIKSGNTVTIPYSISGTNSANATQVSVLILDKEYTAGNTNGAKVLAYDKLNVDSFSTSGTGTYTLPDSLINERMGLDYYAYIVAEDVNGEKETDYASTPVAIPWATPIAKKMNFGTQGIIDPAMPNSVSDAWKGCYVYYGNYDSSPVKYRVLDASTTDYSKDGTTQTMLLDCDSILYYTPFDGEEPYSNVWEDSPIYKSLNGDGFLNKEGVFTTAEKNAIAKSNVASHALTTDSENGVNVASWTQRDFVNYVALTGEQIFLLDAEDVSNGAYGYSMKAGVTENRKKAGSSADYWWLRSAGSYSSYKAGFVYDDGYISYDNVSSNYLGVSPALNLNLSSVLFSSANTVSKSSALTSGSAEIGTEANTDWKLTLKDNEKSVALTEGRSVTKASDGTITVPYTYTDKENATEKEKVNQISVMITDKAYDAEKVANAQEAQILYYGALQDIKNAEGNDSTVAEATTGTGTFALPSGLTGTLGTDYHIYLLAEHVNDDNATDYASEPVKVEKIYLDISEATTEQSNTLTYDGTEKKPKFTVTLGDDVLLEEDYEIETALQKDAGTYTATIQGKGDYTGEITDVSWSIGKGTLTSDMFTYVAPENLYCGGKEKTATVTGKDGLSGIGDVTIRYYEDGEETQPVYAGTYTVKISVADGDNWLETETELTSDAWSFTINHVDEEKDGICDFCNRGYWIPEQNEDGYYLIENASHLMWLAEQVNTNSITGFKAILTKDIVIPNNKWVPMDETDASVLDGNGYSITINCSNYESGFGLFTRCNNSEVKNLILKGNIVVNTAGTVGALCTSAYKSTFTNVISYVNITNSGTGAVGGLAGKFGGQAGSEINNCAVYADISGTTAGGLVGLGWDGYQYYNIKNSVYAGDVTGTTAGAVVGNHQTGNTTSVFDKVYWNETDGLGFFGTTNKAHDLSTVSTKTADQFASGEVTYLLNGLTSEGILEWGQNLKTDAKDEEYDGYPVLKNATNTVYYGYANCQGMITGKTYSNKKITNEVPDHEWEYKLDETNSNKMTIACATEGCTEGGTVTVTVPTGAKYNRAAHEATVTVETTSSEVAIETPEITYTSMTEGVELVDGKPVNAGTYRASVTIGEVTAYGEFEIAKVTPHIVTAPTAATITYGETLKDSVLSGGTVQYSETYETIVTGTWSWKETLTKPVVADSGVTQYDVVFTPDDADNYSVVETKIILTVNRSEIAPNMPKSTMCALYSQKTVDAVELPEGWVWKEADSTKELTVGVAMEVTAIYNGADKGNYVTESVTISITREDCDHEESDVLYTGEGEKTPTCTEAGIGHTECTKCKEIIRTEVKVEETGHTWDAGVVTKEATATEKGEKTYTCTVCKETKTEEVPKVTKTEEVPKVTSAPGSTVNAPVPTLGVTPDDKASKQALPVGTKKTSDDGKATYKVTTSDLTKGTVTYVAPADKKLATVTIPDTVTIDGVKYKVTAIEKNAFKNNKKLKSVTIGKNITKIGKKAFYGCKKLKKLTIKSTKLTVKNVGSKAFGKTPKKMTVKVPKKKFKAYKKMLIKRGVNKKAKFKK